MHKITISSSADDWTWSTLILLMVCSLTAPSYDLICYWLILNFQCNIQAHLYETNGFKWTWTNWNYFSHPMQTSHPFHYRDIIGRHFKFQMKSRDLFMILPDSSIGRPFRSPLRRRRNMAALPLPAAILDGLIPSFLVPGMRSSKMAAGSGRAAILRLRLNGDRKGRPKSWLTSFPAPPSWIQDGGATSNVWRTS